MENFQSLDLPAPLLQALSNMGYDKPTPIQAQAIPQALEGKDILGSAQTGTGKTAAFSIPLIAKLMSNPKGSALVMTPTRELAAQVIDIMNKMLAGQKTIKSALLIGGEHISRQLKQLQGQPRLIVGTPGRINDHLQRGSLRLHDAGFLVLDETDRMLDMGFGIQLDAILPYLPKQRQTLLFSATLPPAIVKLAQKYTQDPVRVSVGETNKVALKIKQETIFLQEAEKYDCLLDQLEKRTGSVVLFIKTKHGADKMAMRLRKDGHEAEAIHGDLRQNKRDQVIRQFRENRFRILVATDVASRGLDIPHIMHVINFDLPQVAEDYIHRIGRTARNDAEGEALCLICPRDARLWRDIQMLLDPAAAESMKSEGRSEGRSGGRGRSEGRSGGRSNDSRGDRGDRGRSDNRSFGSGFAKPAGDVTRNSRGKPTGDFKRAKPAFEGADNMYAKKRPFGTRADGDVRYEKPRGERSENRGEFRGERNEGRADSRPDNNEYREPRAENPRRFEGKGEGRKEVFGEAKFAPRGDSRGERTPFDKKPEWKSDKPAGGFAKKPYAGKSDGFKKPYAGKSEGFEKKPYAGKGEGFAKPEWKSDRPAGKPFGKPAGKSFDKPARPFSNSNSATGGKPEWKSDRPAKSFDAPAAEGKTYVRRPRTAVK